MCGSIVRSVGFSVLVQAAAGLVASAAAAAETVPIDRAVVRFVSSETGGPAFPRYIFERFLAFEARIEAMTDSTARGIGSDGSGYSDGHVRAAMERHISETLLANLRIEPAPTSRELTARTTAVRRSLAQRVGGEKKLRAAQRAEGLAERELLRMLRRQARASLYLDRMVAPMLQPSDAELRKVHLTLKTPYRDRAFEDVRNALRRWYVSRRFAAALGSFYQNVRARLRVTILTD